jgi:IS1 family transposase
MDVSINTVTKLLVDAGTACSEYQGMVFRNLPCKRIQCDEIWSFCYAKAKNVPEDKRGNIGYGDVWTWTAICADSKLIPSWFVGHRDLETAKLFIKDLSKRLAHRVQLTTDGHRPYLDAVENAFGSEIDYSQLIKIYGTPKGEEIRYSPGECCGTITETVTGQPDPAHISTSFAERQNLTMRMCMRRFTRLTNAFSKKLENHVHALALYFMHYNFCRIHKSLRVTPAMATGVTDRVWDFKDILDLMSN